MSENSKKTIIDKKPMCGIIMPIADSPEYPIGHWKEVLFILAEAINETEFEPRLVSDDVAIGLIHERIVNNIYNDEIVICDVSSKNPNVMFELGLRLAFDKPTIIIKDEKTGYSFDTGVIEHLNYPSSLRFNQIVDFKNDLVKKIKGTFEKSKSEKNYSPFLKSFGKTIIPATLNQTEIGESKYILSKLESLSDEIKMLRLNNVQYPNNKFVRDLMSSSERQKLVDLEIKEFLDRNSHLTEKSVKFDFTDVLQHEIKQSYGFNATTAEVAIGVNSYFLEKKQKKIE